MTNSYLALFDFSQSLPLQVSSASTYFQKNLQKLTQKYDKQNLKSDINQFFWSEYFLTWQPEKLDSYQEFVEIAKFVIEVRHCLRFLKPLTKNTPGDCSILFEENSRDIVEKWDKISQYLPSEFVT